MVFKPVHAVQRRLRHSCKDYGGPREKIEGNPLHPINKGKLCSRGQAGLQALYNPDRIKGPLKRMGNRGSGDFEEISWEEGLSILSKNLSELREGGNAGKLHVLTSKLRGHLDILINEFMGAYGSPNYAQYELFGHENLRLANNLSAGINAIPHYDIGETRYLLSFGADFSSTWLSPSTIVTATARCARDAAAAANSFR